MLECAQFGQAIRIEIALILGQAHQLAQMRRPGVRILGREFLGDATAQLREVAPDIHAIEIPAVADLDVRNLPRSTNLITLGLEICRRSAACCVVRRSSLAWEATKSRRAFGPTTCNTVSNSLRVAELNSPHRGGRDWILTETMLTLSLRALFLSCIGR